MRSKVTDIRQELEVELPGLCPGLKNSRQRSSFRHCGKNFSATDVRKDAELT